jgi:hypothetical protein
VSAQPLSAAAHRCMLVERGALCMANAQCSRVPLSAACKLHACICVLPVLLHSVWMAGSYVEGMTNACII